ncbi:MAG: hypothetical protein ACKVUS_19405 [Saprospiraceae bacterium]
MRTISLLVAPFLLFAFGCVQYHYSPNFVQTPYIGDKGDGTVTAGIGGGPKTLNGDFHASYSPVKYGTVMLNYFHTHSSFEDPNFFGPPTYKESIKGYLVEGGVGTYAPFAFGTGALYAGWGQGRMRNDYGIGRIALLQFQRFFVQPTLTFKNDWFRIGMGLRLVRLSFPAGDVDYRIEPHDLEVIQRLERESPFWFSELGGNIGVHFKPVTLSGHLVLLMAKPSDDYGFDGSNMGVSISFDLQEMFKKRGTRNKEL